MRSIAALFFAVILAAAAYAGFWWFSLAYNSAEMRGSVEHALNGALTYGKPSWIPELMAVHVRWPDAKLVLRDGPIREIRADNLVMVSGFITRDRWRLQLPDEVNLLMASGNRLTLETKGGEIVLLSDPERLAFRADELTVLNGSRNVLAHVTDVLVERRPTDEGVRLNLASRPDWGNGTAVLSGQLVLPADVTTALLASFGEAGVPRFGTLAQKVVNELMRTGGTATLDNISFRQGSMSGAVYGTMQVLANGDFAGELAVTADSATRLLGWLEQAGMIGPRTVPERIGLRDLQNRMDRTHPAVRVEVMPGGLLLNGNPVGPVPKVPQVMQRLWP